MTSRNSSPLRAGRRVLQKCLTDLRERRRTAVLLGITAFVVPLALLPLGKVLGVPVTSLTRDATQVTGTPPTIGILTDIGLLGWGAGVALSLFVVGCLPRSAPGNIRAFFAWAAAFSALLLADDALLLHEGYWALPIHEGVFYSAYAIAALLFMRGLTRSPGLGGSGLLLLAFSAFAVSLVLDSSFALDWMHRFETPVTFLEDAFKFVGIAFWVAYLADAGRRVLRLAYGDGGEEEGVYRP